MQNKFTEFINILDKLPIGIPRILLAILIIFAFVALAGTIPLSNIVYDVYVLDQQTQLVLEQEHWDTLQGTVLSLEATLDAAYQDIYALDTLVHQQESDISNLKIALLLAAQECSVDINTIYPGLVDYFGMQ